MTTAADIIEQYARTVISQPEEYNANLDLEPDMHALALIVRDWGNEPIPNSQAESIRKNLTMCPAGQNHWCWDCDKHSCNGAAE